MASLSSLSKDLTCQAILLFTSHSGLYRSLFWPQEIFCLCSQTSFRKRKQIRWISKGSLPETGIAENCPLSRVIFRTWFVQGKLRISNGKSSCSLDLRNSLVDLLVPKHLWSTTSVAPFHLGFLSVDLEIVFFQGQQNSWSLPKRGPQMPLYCVTIVIQHLDLLMHWEIFNTRKFSCPQIGNCSLIDAFLIDKWGTQMNKYSDFHRETPLVSVCSPVVIFEVPHENINPWTWNSSYHGIFLNGYEKSLSIQSDKVQDCWALWMVLEIHQVSRHQFH